MALHPEASGEIWLIGQRLQAGTLTRRLRQGLALVPEDRQREGLVQTLSVAQNMLLASLTRYRQSFFLSARKEGVALSQMIERDLPE